MHFIDTDGRKRKSIIIKCAFCDKEVITRLDQPKKFCSKQCTYESRKNRILCICAQCNKSFERAGSRIEKAKHRYFFCSRDCKDKAQRLDGIREIHPAHYGNGRHSYRNKFNKEQLVCSRCGYKEFPVSVEIHHLDKDRANNIKSNLLPLCANCHRAWHHGCWN